MNKQAFISIVVIILMGVSVFAQEHQEEVTIVGEYNPTINQAFKLNTSPKIPAEVIELPPMVYNVKAKQINTNIELDPIAPAAVKGERQSNLHRNFIKAGFGNYTTPYLEVFANNIRNKKYNLGVHLKHHSSAGDIKDYAPSGFSNSLGEIYGESYTSTHTYFGKVNYSYNQVHRYGFMPDSIPGGTDVTKEDIRQRYQKIGAKAGLLSNYTRGKKLHHSLSIEGYHYFDYYEASEQRFNLTGDIHKDLKLFDYSDYQQLGLAAYFTFLNNKDTITDSKTTLWSVKPYFESSFDVYTIHVGVEVAGINDSASKVHFFPDLFASIEIIEGGLVAKAGLRGGLTENSFASLSQENPFVNSGLDMRTTVNKFEVYGGISGNLGAGFDYDIHIGLSTMENMALFVNDFTDPLRPTFNVIYDEGNLFRTGIELTYKYQDKANLWVKGNLLGYSVKNEMEPWHKPKYILNAGGKINVAQRVNLMAEIISKGKMYARIPDGAVYKAVEIDGWLDLGFGVEYLVSDKFSAWVNVHNLLNSPYERWYAYPVQKLNAMGGLTYAF